MAKVTESKGKKENKSNFKETAKKLLNKASSVTPAGAAVNTIKKIATAGKKEDSSSVKNLKERLNKPAEKPEKRKRKIPPFDLKTMPKLKPSPDRPELMPRPEPNDPGIFKPMPNIPRDRNQFKPLPIPKDRNQFRPMPMPAPPIDKPKKYKLFNKGGRAGLRGGGICKKGMNKKARGANS